MKKRILHFIGVQAVRAAAIVILFGLTVGAMMYLRGYFDFSFVERVPIGNAAKETLPVVTEAVTEPQTGNQRSIVQETTEETTEETEPEETVKPTKPTTPTKPSKP